MRVRVTLLTFLAAFIITATLVAIASFFGMNPSGLLIASALGLGMGIAAAVIAGRLAVNLEIDTLLKLRDIVKGLRHKKLEPYTEPREYEIAHPIHFIYKELSAIQQEIDTLTIEANRHQRLFDNMSDGVLIADAEGRVITANEACLAIFGLSGFLADSGLQHILIEPALLEAARRVLAEGGMEELRVVRKKRTFLAIINSGGDGGVILLLRDITQLEEAEKIRSEFVSNVSHELKTPLTSIRGFTELLMSGKVADEETKNKYLGLIDSESHRLMLLINDILNLSELEALEGGQYESVTIEVNLAELAAEVAETLKGVAAAQKVTIRTDLQPCIVKADPIRIKEMLINLTDNAIKYNIEGGTVTVTTATDGENAFLRVSDTGIGIPEESQSRIFERFYRVDKGRSRKAGGTGLGLAIVKHIAELYHGGVSVQSEVGKGTTMQVLLPAVAKAQL